jgi:hypothetical protein
LCANQPSAENDSWRPLNCPNPCSKCVPPRASACHLHLLTVAGDAWLRSSSSNSMRTLAASRRMRSPLGRHSMRLSSRTGGRGGGSGTPGLGGLDGEAGSMQQAKRRRWHARQQLPPQNNIAGLAAALVHPKSLTCVHALDPSGVHRPVKHHPVLLLGNPRPYAVAARRGPCTGGHCGLGGRGGGSSSSHGRGRDAVAPLPGGRVVPAEQVLGLDGLWVEHRRLHQGPQHRRLQRGGRGLCRGAGCPRRRGARRRAAAADAGGVWGGQLVLAVVLEVEGGLEGPVARRLAAACASQERRAGIGAWESGPLPQARSGNERTGELPRVPSSACIGALCPPLVSTPRIPSLFCRAQLPRLLGQSG